MTLKENYIDEINSLKKKLKDLNIKIQNYEEKI